MIHYLTVQDVLWINHAVTHKTNEFKFAQLEEATFGQYGYGKSERVLGQAATFLESFVRLRPFSEGNRKTAFISVLAFLKMNGFAVKLEDAEGLRWIMDTASKKITGEEAIRQVAQEGAGEGSLKPLVRTIVKDLIGAFPETLSELADAAA